MTSPKETRTRIMVVEITADLDWLTGGGEVLEEDGWELIQRSLRLSRYPQGPSNVELNFKEWQEVPE